jgi:hypothetical protein
MPKKSYAGDLPPSFGLISSQQNDRPERIIADHSGRMTGLAVNRRRDGLQ